MRFYRFNDIDIMEESMWVCEKCVSKVPENCDYLDADGDKYGDHQCEFCGVSYNHELDEYEICD